LQLYFGDNILAFVNKLREKWFGFVQKKKPLRVVWI